MIRHALLTLIACALLASCTATKDHIGNGETAHTAGSVVAKIFLSHQGLVAVALSRNGHLAYVAGLGHVFVVDLKTRKVVGRIHVPRFPWGVAVSPQDGDVFAAGLFGDVVSVLDPLGKQIISTIDLESMAIPLGAPRFAVPDHGTLIYLTNPCSDRLHVIDLKTHTLKRSIALPIHPRAIATPPDGSRIFVGGCPGSCTSGTVLVLNADASMHQLTTLETVVRGLTFDPAHDRLYVVTAREIGILDPNTGRVLGAINGKFSGDVAIANGNLLCVRSGLEQPGPERFSLIDAQKAAVIATVPLRGGFGIALGPKGRLAYVPTGDSLAVLDLTKLAPGSASLAHNDPTQSP